MFSLVWIISFSVAQANRNRHLVPSSCCSGYFPAECSATRCLAWVERVADRVERATHSRHLGHNPATQHVGGIWNQPIAATSPLYHR